ncbi:hypothetical protein Agub_g4260, partial [Astrephomene gubernaculifera]
KAAPSGLYCGPLRLLACEVADRLAAEGVPCHLVTGQEVRPAFLPATRGDGKEEDGTRGPDHSSSSNNSDHNNRNSNHVRWRVEEEQQPQQQQQPQHSPRPARHTACTVEMADVQMLDASSLMTTTTHPQPPSSPSTSPHYLDVAVLDEIQMLGDRHRGWAWTRALLGVAAAEVHVAGDGAVLPVLRELVEQCGDELDVRHYHRLSPLVVQSEALGSLGAAAGGDCLVGFSRRSLHAMRREVVRRSGREASLVYGGLPPEARRQQAALFNEASVGPQQTQQQETAGGEQQQQQQQKEQGAHAGGGTGEGPMGRRNHQSPPQHAHGRSGSDSDSSSSSSGSDDTGSTGGAAAGAASDGSAGGASAAEGAQGAQGAGAGSRVLCASDAIGMGLNLNIRRVVFTSLQKYDGRIVRPLEASEVRQIAGRAGRFSSTHPTGYVTTLHPADLPALHRALGEAPQPVSRACLLPSSEHLVAYARLHPHRPLATSLLAFAAAAQLGPAYLYASYEGVYGIASALRHLEGRLEPEELILFSTAPADMDDPSVA